MVIDGRTVYLTHLTGEIGSVVICAMRAPIVDVSISNAGVSETLRARHEPSSWFMLSVFKLTFVIIARDRVVLLKWGET